MLRLLAAAKAMSGAAAIDFRNHRRLAKNGHGPLSIRAKDKKARLYRDLLKATTNTLAYLEQAQITVALTSSAQVEQWHAQVEHYKPLIKQSLSRHNGVLQGEKVPVSEKIFSIFETRDMIIKGSRDIQYGHKLNLSSGKSGLILDLVIETGNPADTHRPMLDRHIKNYAAVPRQLAVDGGYASKANLDAAKARGVEDVAP